MRAFCRVLFSEIGVGPYEDTQSHATQQLETGGREVQKKGTGLEDAAPVSAVLGETLEVFWKPH